MSNGPYALVLDCDMYCNDPTSAKQAMCFHLDPTLSHSLSYVQFPQIFYNVSQNDIYDGQARAAYKVPPPYLSLNYVKLIILMNFMSRPNIKAWMGKEAQFVLALATTLGRRLYSPIVINKVRLYLISNYFIKLIHKLNESFIALI